MEDAVTGRTMMAWMALVFAAGPAHAACQPALPVIHSDKDRIFTAEAFARPVWRQRGSDGRMYSYSRQIWRGRIGGRIAYLTFDEIPGTSGPNHAMAWSLDRLSVPLRWERAGRYDLGETFVIRSGPLHGVWTVTNCSS
jgi:hypothetical protein